VVANGLSQKKEKRGAEKTQAPEEKRNEANAQEKETSSH